MAGGRLFWPSSSHPLLSFRALLSPLNFSTTFDTTSRHPLPLRTAFAAPALDSDGLNVFIDEHGTAVSQSVVVIQFSR